MGFTISQQRRQAIHLQTALGLRGKGYCQCISRPHVNVHRVSHVSRSSGRENQDSKDEFGLVSETDASRDLCTLRETRNACIVHAQCMGAMYIVFHKDRLFNVLEQCDAGSLQAHQPCGRVGRLLPRDATAFISDDRRE